MLMTDPATSSPIPGDPPHRRIDAGRREPADEVLLGSLARVPVVAEGFRVGVPDPPMVGLDDRPDLEPFGQRRIGNRVGQVPDHHEAVSDLLVALRLEQGDGAQLGVTRPTW